MKPFGEAYNSVIDERETAGLLIDTVPLIMRTLRQEIRSRRPVEFSVPQFRVLAFLRRNEGATLSDVASHIGLMRPTMSKMIDNLVHRGWVARATSPEDRRCMHLKLTRQGLDAINAAREETRGRLAEMFAPLSKEDLATVHRALEVMQQVFEPGGLGEDD